MSQNQGEIILYQTNDGKTSLALYARDGSVWMDQAQIAELFNTSKPNTNIHIDNTLKENKLPIDSVIKDHLTTAADGKNYKIKYYNLDAAISVGYRVNSAQATQFRIWATQILNPKGASYVSLGQRPRFAIPPRQQALKGRHKYEPFNKNQAITSDFDELTKQLKQDGGLNE